MRGRTTLTILVFFGAMLIPQSAHAYTIVRKNGTKFEAQGPPEYKDGKAIFMLAGGSRGSMAESDVNKPATEKANAAPAPPASPKKGAAAKGPKGDAGKGVATNEALAGKEPAKKMPAGGGKSSFTNEDLAKAEGKGTVEGSVKTDAPGEGAAADGEEDWAKRHDEEMARLAEERKKAGEGGEEAGKDAMSRDSAAADKAKKDAEDAAAGGEGGAPKSSANTGGPGGDKGAPPANETKEEKTARMEKERDDLREKLNSIDQKIGGGAGDSTTVNERLETAEKLNKAEEELEQEKGE